MRLARPGILRTLICAFSIMALTVSGAASAAPTPKPKPTKNSKYTAAIAAASDDLTQVNVKVRRASAKLAAAQARLPGARRTYSRAMSALGQARAADVRAASALAAAIARARASAQALVRSDTAVHASEAEFAHLVRQIYMSGGTMLQAQVVLESRDPVDLGTRIVGVDRVGRMSNRRLATLRTIRTTNAQIGRAHV